MPKRNCKIAPFLQRKNPIKYVGAIAPTAPRPCRGGENQEKGGSSATADFSKETSFCLDKDTARHSPRLPKKKSGALSFSGLGRAGRGETPFSFAQTRDSKNLENIRENTTLKNRESTESSADSESGADSKTITESNAEILKDAQLIESSHIDSGTITESKEILKNEKTQNLGGAESKFSLDSVDCLESSSVYRKCASPRGVNEVAAPRDSINLLKNAVYERAAERAEIHSPRAIHKFVKQTCIKILKPFQALLESPHFL